MDSLRFACGDKVRVPVDGKLHKAIVKGGVRRNSRDWYTVCLLDRRKVGKNFVEEQRVKTILFPDEQIKGLK